ncbi:MAG: peptide deformylase [Clostridia bacterium]|nr:peptide deformylase [Clostridia bacterium]
MAIRKIITIGDETLRKVSKEVEVINKRTITLLDDMIQTLWEAQGAGLAAPQVGVLKRIFVADCGQGLVEFINPVITEMSGEQDGPEGCLSVPDRPNDTVKRPMYVTVEAIDRNGKPFTMKASGLMARCICHETDHLDGILYIDKMNKPEVKK